MPNAKKMIDVTKTKSAQSIKSISWQAPEFIQFDRSVWWYVILILTGLGLMTAFFFMDRNYLGMGVVGLAVIVMIILAGQKPHILNYTISSEEITIGDKSIPISEFKSYYVTFVNNVANLHFEKSKKISMSISVYLNELKAKEILDFVETILPENVKINNTASDLFSNWFKF